MNQHSASLLSEDQLQEPPAVHLAIGMIAAELELSCAAALDVLHQRAVDRDLSLVSAAQEVLRRDTPPPGDGGSASSLRNGRPVAVRRGRWAIRNAQDLVSRESAGRR